MHNHVYSLSADQFRTIPLTDLEFPDTFIGSLFTQVDQHILDQVERFGILQPLPVQQVVGQSFRLLAGYPYLPVLRKLGYKEVICQVIIGSSLFSCFAMQICHSLSTVQISPILQAHLLKAAMLTLAEMEVMQLLSLLGYKPQRYKMQELVALLDLSPSSVLALHRGFIALKTGRLLSRLSKEDQDNLVELIEKYRPGWSKQQKLIEMLIELSLRHNQSIEALVNPWMGSRQDDDPANVPQQLQSLLRYLQELSFPHLTDAEKRFQRLIQELNPPICVQLNHSASFEDESVELRILCKDIPSFKKLWTSLPRLLPNP